MPLRTSGNWSKRIPSRFKSRGTEEVAIAASGFWKKPDARQTLKVFILRPKSGFRPYRGGVNDAVRQGELVTCRIHRQLEIEVYHFPRPHQAGNLQRFTFATLPNHLLEDLVNRDHRDDEIFAVFKRGGEVGRLACICQIFEPCRGIYDVEAVQSRSSSRQILVFIPLRKPRISLILATGADSRGSTDLKPLNVSPQAWPL